MFTKLLAIYSSVLSTALAITMVVGTTSAAVQRFDEIDVHRINVREPDGTLRMVVSNHDRIPGVIVRGKKADRVDRPQAGMLFYNDEGTENGGLIFGGRRDANGKIVNSGISLSFDKYGARSQFVQLAGVDDSTAHIVGLILSDSDETRTRRRIAIGPDKDGVAKISLMDRDGRPRIQLQVAGDGTPSIVFLDATGNTVTQLGPASSAPRPVPAASR